MAENYAGITINADRVIETELRYARGELRYLCFGVRAGVFVVRDELLNGPPFDALGPCGSRHISPPKKYPCWIFGGCALRLPVERFLYCSIYIDRSNSVNQYQRRNSTQIGTTP